jgi:hypothetical protein
MVEIRVFGVCWRCKEEDVELFPDPLDDDATIDQAVCMPCHLYLIQLVEDVDDAESW